MMTSITNTAIQVKKIAYQIFQQTLNILAPSFCAACTIPLTDDAILCCTCKKLITPIISHQFTLKQYQITVLAISRYTFPLKQLILAKRWSQLAISTQLGHLMWDMTYVRNSLFDYIVPIPLHWTRFAQRGYNHATSIAQVISKKSNKPIAHLLHRNKKTAFQSSLPIADRPENLKQAFTLAIQNPEAYYDKNLLIVDDLYTTGATVKTACKELMKLNPASITVVVACRSI